MIFSMDKGKDPLVKKTNKKSERRQSVEFVQIMNKSTNLCDITPKKGDEPNVREKGVTKRNFMLIFKNRTMHAQRIKKRNRKVLLKFLFRMAKRETTSKKWKTFFSLAQVKHFKEHRSCAVIKAVFFVVASFNLIKKSHKKCQRKSQWKCKTERPNDKA